LQAGGPHEANGGPLPILFGSRPCGRAGAHYINILYDWLPAMKTILIHGSAGFLGSHLCEELLARGCRVLAADRGEAPPGALAHLLDNPRFRYLGHGPASAPALDEIYHLAGPSDPPEPPALAALAGRTGARLLRARAGGFEGEPATPEAGPRAARLFHAYGPGMPAAEGGFLSRAILQALAGAPVTLPGPGTRPLALCFVDDLVAGLIALMAAPAGFGGPVDLGSPSPVAAQELARMIIRLAGSDSPILPGPRPAGPDPAPPDLTLARALGWAPKVPLETGLRRTLDHQVWLSRQPDRPPAGLGR